ncbi:hypothetical protein BLS_001955 [Venturia inaequalis]|uniref:DUF7587 domain-containing protein n=1 Tax=Venturia inaequalis TaxID=5025 RepID=A0A8H3UHE9_VENIN|nr:hypothetical protein EG328_006158 [Venturia inaequalis]KAE9977865.1 hypothetical protein EG327_007573 [Venturia inaequalis]KAE9984580.1 hypothetical protein BLS_001955 [Venturia inaequalis]
MPRPSRACKDPDGYKPKELYPLKQRQKLESSRAKNPTYLFRASSSISGSGIEVTEGDGVSMVPRAFLNAKKGHKTIYEIPDLVNMVTGHLRGSKDIASEFSSWAASFSVAMAFLQRHLSQPDSRISVIDTRRFPDTAIYHVNEFKNAGFEVDSFAHEYLLHGVVEGSPGSGYSSVLWSGLRRLGIYKVMPRRPGGLCPLPEPLPTNTIMPPLEIADIQTAKRIAMAYGPLFAVPVIAALLSHTHRSWQRPESELAEKEVEAIARVMREGDVALVEDYSRVTAVMEDIVFTSRFEDVKQQITLLRLLSEYIHGKNAEIQGQTAMQEVDQTMRLVGKTGMEKKKSAATKKGKWWIQASGTIKSLISPDAFRALSLLHSRRKTVSRTIG